MRLTAKYKGVPSPYTHTASVKASEPIKVKYATVAVEYPSAPPHKNTIINGINTALKRTGKNPQSSIRKGSFFKNLPTRYELNAASRVAKDPMNTS